MIWYLIYQLISIWIWIYNYRISIYLSNAFKCITTMNDIRNIGFVPKQLPIWGSGPRGTAVHALEIRLQTPGSIPFLFETPQRVEISPETQGWCWNRIGCTFWNNSEVSENYQWSTKKSSAHQNRMNSHWIPHKFLCQSETLLTCVLEHWASSTPVIWDPDPGIRQAVAIWIDATKEKQCAIHVVQQSLAGWWPNRKKIHRNSGNYSKNHSTEYSNPAASLTLRSLSWPKA